MYFLVHFIIPVSGLKNDIKIPLSLVLPSGERSGFGMNGNFCFYEPFELPYS
jgi:hypothetical protein